MLETLIENATRLCGADRGQIYRADGDVLRFAIVYGVAPEVSRYLEQRPLAISPASLADLEEFTGAHRGHGDLFAAASPPGPNGYRLEVRCHCGVVFERWVTPDDAGVELALWARWN